jgi:hypothetical protein
LESGSRPDRSHHYFRYSLESTYVVQPRYVWSKGQEMNSRNAASLVPGDIFLQDFSFLYPLQFVVDLMGADHESLGAARMSWRLRQFTTESPRAYYDRFRRLNRAVVATYWLSKARGGPSNGSSALYWYCYVSSPAAASARGALRRSIEQPTRCRWESSSAARTHDSLSARIPFTAPNQPCLSYILFFSTYKS